MFRKIITTACAAIVLATAIGSAASAQTARKQGVQPHTTFEKLWFALPQGQDS